MGTKLLLVEDDIFLQDGLCELLRREGYSIDCAGTYKEARCFAAENTYSLIILDIVLPDGNGLDLCATWRSAGKDTPILFLTARDDEIQVVRGLDAGGDDYVTKPFRMLELLSRIRALLRRNQTLLYNKGGLRIDLQKMSVYYNDARAGRANRLFCTFSVDWSIQQGGRSFIRVRISLPITTIKFLFCVGAGLASCFRHIILCRN
ncbi:MAG: response regulator [Dethiobacter sp.]|jgi:DNA-binding response OmpR family regulator|nr:response regulator [Dethiobacter sp.]